MCTRLQVNNRTGRLINMWLLVYKHNAYVQRAIRKLYIYTILHALSCALTIVQYTVRKFNNNKAEGVVNRIIVNQPRPKIYRFNSSEQSRVKNDRYHY